MLTKEAEAQGLKLGIVGGYTRALHDTGVLKIASEEVYEVLVKEATSLVSDEPTVEEVMEKVAALIEVINQGVSQGTFTMDDVLEGNVEFASEK